MPAPNAIEGIVAGPSVSLANLGADTEAALGVFARMDNIALANWCSVGFTAESAPIDQPVRTIDVASMVPIETVGSTSLQTVGLRFGLGESTAADSVKQLISECCGLRAPGYTPPEDEKARCDGVGIELNSSQGCSESEMIEAVGKALSGFHATVGLRGIGSNGHPPFPGGAAELSLSYSHVRFGASLAGYGAYLDDYRSPASEVEVNRPGSLSWRGAAILHTNFSLGGASRVVRVGLMAAFTSLSYENLANESVSTEAYEAKAFVSLHGGAGFQGSLTLGLLKPPGEERVQFVFGLLPSVGSAL